MAHLLESTEQVEHDSPTERHVGCRGIHAELDSQRTILFEQGEKSSLGQGHLNGPGDVFELLLRRLHPGKARPSKRTHEITRRGKTGSIPALLPLHGGPLRPRLSGQPPGLSIAIDRRLSASPL